MIPAPAPDMVDAYLSVLGLASAPPTDREGLTSLIDAHLRRVPMENLDVFYRRGVSADPVVAVDKIVNRHRGGWCFELNGAFASLLVGLGFDVRLLGAAVLLSGPNRVVDHLALEVTLDRPYLVDVGFGRGPARPLALNQTDIQDSGTAHYQFMPSPEGTTLVEVADDGLVPQYRFRRVSLSPEDLAPASDRLYNDETSWFVTGRFVTRLMDTGYDRVTLSDDNLHLTVDGVTTTAPVPPEEWEITLRAWFPGLSVDS